MILQYKMLIQSEANEEENLNLLEIFVAYIYLFIIFLFSTALYVVAIKDGLYSPYLLTSIYFIMFLVLLSRTLILTSICLLFSEKNNELEQHA